MTGYTVHTGTSKKFSNGWDRIFGGDSPADPPEKAPKKPKAKEKSPQAKQKKKKKKG